MKHSVGFFHEKENNGSSIDKYSSNHEDQNKYMRWSPFHRLKDEKLEILMFCEESFYDYQILNHCLHPWLKFNFVFHFVFPHFKNYFNHSCWNHVATKLSLKHLLLECSLEFFTKQVGKSKIGVTPKRPWKTSNESEGRNQKPSTKLGLEVKETHIKIILGNLI